MYAFDINRCQSISQIGALKSIGWNPYPSMLKWIYCHKKVCVTHARFFALFHASNRIVSQKRFFVDCRNFFHRSGERFFLFRKFFLLRKISEHIIIRRMKKCEIRTCVKKSMVRTTREKGFISLMYSQYSPSDSKYSRLSCYRIVTRKQ